MDIFDEMLHPLSVSANQISLTFNELNLMLYLPRRTVFHLIIAITTQITATFISLFERCLMLLN